ncbi:hypothetical protein J1605_007119 [Eschrichtius robustus]|uniref:Uncharacterized protein n=1 Tax=Eschrichtius robustus TaxID=9764 RepID=A0AB34GYF5_ESCRO|nr:hypothetical protein J1605_007119 [Eschrichtius robustus]
MSVMKKDFGVGGATGKRVPRNVYARVHGRLKREGTKYWVWKVARRPQIMEGACVLEAFPLLLHHPSGSAAALAPTSGHPLRQAPPPPAPPPPALRPLLRWCRVAAPVVEVSVPEAGSAESFPGAPARL